MTTGIDSSKPVHFVGVGGIGMSAIARVLLDEGCQVSGSDLKLSPLTEGLAAKGARIYAGHAAANVGQAALVVVSSAVPAENPEIVEARRRGIPVIKRAEMLGRLMQGRRGIAVAGTHGKTTTSSLIALILERADLDPTVLVGGEIVDLGSNARVGRGEYLVAEADEFDGSFLRLAPHLAVVTNVEADHLDYYGDLLGVMEAFRQFMSLVPADGHVIACADDPLLQQILDTRHQLATRVLLRAPVTTYGFAAEAAWRATDLAVNERGGYDFLVWHQGEQVGRFGLAIPGRHNVSNALAAVVVSDLLHVDRGLVRATLASFRGARRRFELKGEVGGVTVIEDYAHHPTEIAATLRAARERFGSRRLVAIFQPHTYSRTKALLREFGRCFGDADEVLITDIYAARERDTLGVSAADLAAAADHPALRYAGSLATAEDYLAARLQSGDVLLVLGAGDIYQVGERVLARRRETGDAGEAKVR